MITSTDRPSIKDLLAYVPVAIANRAIRLHKTGLFQLYALRCSFGVNNRSAVAKIDANYRGTAKAEFLSGLSDQDIDRLKAAGMDGTGVLCLSMGLSPFDAQGRVYNLGIDHIIDRAIYVSTKPTSLHTCSEPANLVLLEDWTHEIKSDLVDAQRHQAICTFGRNPPYTWILTITPRRYPAHDSAVILNQLGFKPFSFKRGLETGEKLVGVLRAEFSDLDGLLEEKPTDETGLKFALVELELKLRRLSQILQLTEVFWKHLELSASMAHPDRTYNLTKLPYKTQTARLNDGMDTLDFFMTKARTLQENFGMNVVDYHAPRRMPLPHQDVLDTIQGGTDLRVA